MQGSALIEACALALHAHIVALHLEHKADESLLDDSAASSTPWCELPKCPLPPAFCERSENDSLSAGEFAEQLASLETFETVRGILVNAHTMLNMQPETFVLAIVLIERLMSASGGMQQGGSLRLRTVRMLIACAVAIATKYHEDDRISLAGIRLCMFENRAPAKAFARCERFFLACIRYRVHCDMTLYARYQCELLALITVRKATLDELLANRTLSPSVSLQTMMTAECISSGWSASLSTRMGHALPDASQSEAGSFACSISSSESVDCRAEVEAEDLPRVLPQMSSLRLFWWLCCGAW